MGCCLLGAHHPRAAVPWGADVGGCGLGTGSVHRRHCGPSPGAHTQVRKRHSISGGDSTELRAQRGGSWVVTEALGKGALGCGVTAFGGGGGRRAVGSHGAAGSKG